MNLGIFESDKFKLQELTAAINEAPALPSRLATLGIFQEEGILTTNLVVEKNVDTLSLVANQSRSGTPTGTGGSSRSVVVFPTTHLPTLDTITADDIQNLRAFGSASEEETMPILRLPRFSFSNCCKSFTARSERSRIFWAC